jgi:hypothetical protein
VRQDVKMETSRGRKRHDRKCSEEEHRGAAELTMTILLKRLRSSVFHIMMKRLSEFGSEKVRGNR